MLKMKMIEGLGIWLWCWLVVTDPCGVYGGGLEQLDRGCKVGEKEENYAYVLWKTQGDYCEYGRGYVKPEKEGVLVFIKWVCVVHVYTYEWRLFLLLS